MTTRCTLHNLAAGPDGMCVLCRREREAGVASREAPSRAAVAWVIGGTLALALLGAVRFWQPRPAVIASEPAPAHSAPATPAPVEPTDDTPTPPSVWDGHGKLPTAPEPTMRAALAVAATATGGDAPQPPTQADLRAAMRDVPIQMYSTSWCPSCAHARSWLTANHIAFADHDVDVDAAARQRQLRLNPRGSIPTIDIDGEVVIGFSPQAVGEAIKHAVDRRLARR